MTYAAFWWVNTVSVKTYLGNSGHVRTFADAVEVACWVEEGNTLVRDSNGDEVVSSTRVFAALDAAASFPPGSEVTLPGDRAATVIATARFDSGSLSLGVDHVEVALT